jgi:hypothetical protein
VKKYYFSGDKIEKNEMGGACSSDGEGRGIAQDFGGEIRRKKATGKAQV